jgi:hypothetical protein
MNNPTEQTPILGTPHCDVLMARLSQDELIQAYREVEQQRIAVKAYTEKLNELTQFIVHALRLKMGLRASLELTMGIDFELHPEWKEGDEA